MTRILRQARVRGGDGTAGATEAQRQPYDQEAATWHAAERSRLIGTGRTPTFVDGQIAAIAATRRLILVTRNVTDFAGFEDLRVEDWFAP